MKKKTLVLVGPMCSGKTSIATELVQNHGFKKIVTYTTRPMRKGEVDGVDYHFITNEVFDSMVSNGLFSEYYWCISADVLWQYGSAMSDYIMGDGYPRVIILNPHGVYQLGYVRSNAFVVFLDTPIDDVYRSRLSRRGDNIEEVDRRMSVDIIDFNKFRRSNDYDLRINETVYCVSVIEKIMERMDLDGQYKYDHRKFDACR